ncbi:hypothetical protein M231_06899 [Tremella mesenterica]|uniref:Uncharacterized protein n=1 Tax=Tremella mesenterica TaxID=5217 RepID=A0A4Q1BFZ3_TREME|nr:hypothetical protein M231_06899 [Tremella mesenterica]
MTTVPSDLSLEYSGTPSQPSQISARTATRPTRSILLSSPQPIPPDLLTFLEHDNAEPKRASQPWDTGERQLYTWVDGRILYLAFPLTWGTEDATHWKIRLIMREAALNVEELRSFLFKQSPETTLSGEKGRIADQMWLGIVRTATEKVELDMLDQGNTIIKSNWSVGILPDDHRLPKERGMMRELVYHSFVLCSNWQHSTGGTNEDDMTIEEVASGNNMVE